MIDGKALGVQLRAMVCALFGLEDPNPSSTEAVSGNIVIVPDVRDKPKAEGK